MESNDFAGNNDNGQNDFGNQQGGPEGQQGQGSFGGDQGGQQEQGGRGPRPHRCQRRVRRGRTGARGSGPGDQGQGGFGGEQGGFDQNR